MNENTQGMGETIRLAREAKHLSQETLAERLEVSRQAVSKWENDLAAPHGRHRALLEAVLEIKLQPEAELSKKQKLFAWGGWLLAFLLLIALIVVLAARQGGAAASVNTPSPALADSVPSPAQAVSLPEESRYVNHKYVFPNGADLVTDYNREILSRERLGLELELPKGWTAQSGAPASFPYGMNGLYSLEYLFDEEENCVGAIGFNLLPPDAGEGEKLPMELFYEVALGNDWRFTVREDYEIVSKTENGETALTRVYRAGTLLGLEQGTESYSPGILLCDKELGVFVAVDLAADVLPDAAVTHIAESMKLG